MKAKRGIFFRARFQVYLSLKKMACYFFKTLVPIKTYATSLVTSEVCWLGNSVGPHVPCLSRLLERRSKLSPHIGSFKQCKGSSECVNGVHAEASEYPGWGCLSVCPCRGRIHLTKWAIDNPQENYCQGNLLFFDSGILSMTYVRQTDSKMQASLFYICCSRFCYVVNALWLTHIVPRNMLHKKNLSMLTFCNKLKIWLNVCASLWFGILAWLVVLFFWVRSYSRMGKIHCHILIETWYGCQVNWLALIHGLSVGHPWPRKAENIRACQSGAQESTPAPV